MDRAIYGNTETMRKEWTMLFIRMCWDEDEDDEDEYY